MEGTSVWNTTEVHNVKYVYSEDVNCVWKLRRTICCVKFLGEHANVNGRSFMIGVMFVFPSSVPGKDKLSLLT
ncbi:MAG: hypothetical protein ACTS4Y_01090, partial [Candidatus Hodgkinia cicadicola]